MLCLRQHNTAYIYTIQTHIHTLADHTRIAFLRGGKIFLSLSLFGRFIPNVPLKFFFSHLTWQIAELKQMLDTGWIHTSTYIKVTYTLTLIPDGDIESRRWRYLKVISLGYKCIGTLCKISEGCLSSSSILVLSETSWSTLNIFFLYKRKALERSERREKNRDFNSWCGSFSLSLAMIDSRLRWVHIPVGCARRRQAAFYFYFNRKFPLIFVSSRAHLLVKSQKAWKSIFVYEKKLYTLKKWLIFFFEKNVRFLPTLAAAAAAFGLSQIHT